MVETQVANKANLDLFPFQLLTPAVKQLNPERLHVQATVWPPPSANGNVSY